MATDARSAEENRKARKGEKVKKLISAHETYGILVGEIGIPHHTVLYEMQFWQINQAIEGYNRRNREMLSMIRWQTFHIMGAFMGGQGLQASHLYSPADLIKFPWDSTSAIPGISPEEAEDTEQELMSIIKQSKQQVNPQQ